MKILIVSPFFSPVIGGVESVLDTTCNALLGAGHTIEVLTSSAGRAPKAEFKQGKLRILRSDLLKVPDTEIIPAREFEFNQVSQLFDEVLNEFEPSVIHFHNYQMRQYAMFLNAFLASSRSRKSVTVNTIHNDTDDPFSQYVLSYSPLDQVITITKKASVELFQAGVPPAKVTHVPNMIDAEKYRTADGTSIRRVLGVDSSVPLILYPSRIVGREGNLIVDSVRGKGLDILIRALPEVLEYVPDAKILLLGNDPIFQNASTSYKNQLKEVAERIGGDENLLFFSRPIPNGLLPQIFAASDLVVSLSSRETFGMVFLEGMAAGKPVVGVNSWYGGVSEVVPDESAGYLVPECNSHLTARAITKLLLDEDKRIQMGLNGIKWVKQRFDVNVVLPRLVAAYQTTLEKKKIYRAEEVESIPMVSQNSISDEST